MNRAGNTRQVGVLCIGSNHLREQSFALAHRLLKAFLPNIRWACYRETRPIGISNPAWFWNQVGVFETYLSADELRQQFKEIERQAGRLSTDKEQELICLDIDLLWYNQKPLKPEEMKRDYVIASLNELQETTMI